MNRIKFNTYPTPIEFYGEYNNNNIYIKRDDLTEPALGGNKVRKLELFLADAKNKNADYIVTYGAPQSNHCRLTVAMAHKMGFKTLLILSESKVVNYNGNFFIFDLFDTEIVWTGTDRVPKTIENTLGELKRKGFNPYFIQGGGHGNIGTHAYKLAFDEIKEQEQQMNVSFDYIFHASGTGTTQSGLIAGKLINNSNINIVGISVARNEERGKEVIEESLVGYFEEYSKEIQIFKNEIIFIDDYVGKGYADIYPEIISTIKYVVRNSSLLLDPVYTGKAFYGMLKHLENNEIKNRNILFIHTGGIPLLFNYASNFKEE
ncbi:pyridoxal-phosphate dependent enzyme [Lederbergia sp. NSJ-179]|uniref:1-aminocyclopropane-1-carboxylate deaminase/D-cysteine desulfhydrase n=1 Tax=Lederbergia sp. NSJ-179 TaxID=2931402 RepID=UPI001FD2F554|nr:pyridoxal-phosphate dependent enzyme [Lederbergia sp. NSJ-179]MCJ7840671.1 pyridoxal-phosphate dependent enzyme [Lederbergia sp. NSJ-179]